ncbi:MAG: stage II sporulation protein M [Clostridia bacterium]|nr:stage II sporulation protein M [Clostridia bacterium]
MKKLKKSHNFKSIIYMHVINNIKEYFSVILVFLISIIIGVIAINSSNENQVLQINDYINNFINSLKEYGNINKSSLLIETLTNNLYLVVALWFVGSTVIGMPLIYGIVAYKGFCLSYTISSCIITLGTYRGTIFSICATLLQNIIYIPCLIAIAVSGIKLYKSIVKDRRRENIKIEIIRHSFFSLFITIFIIIGSLVETYLSTNLIMLCMDLI